MSRLHTPPGKSLAVIETDVGKGAEAGTGTRGLAALMVMGAGLLVAAGAYQYLKGRRGDGDGVGENR